MALFLGLYLGHVLGDFVFQPGRLVIAKRHGPGGVALHTAIVMACTALVMATSIPRTWPVVVLAGLAHFGVEHMTIGARRTRRTSGLSVFLLDQALHVVSLVLLALAFGTAVPASVLVFETDVRTLAAVAAVATVAFAGSILVFEVELVRRPTEVGTHTESVLKLDGSRVYGMAERAAGLGLALLAPVPLIGALAFAPRMIVALGKPGPARAEQTSAAAVGAGLCAVAWALVALVSRIA